MIPELIDQARAFLIFQEDLSTFVLRDGQETFIKQIDYPSLIKTIEQTNFQSDWYLSNFRLLKMSQLDGKIFTVSSLAADIYLLRFEDFQLKAPLPKAVVVHCQSQLWLYAYRGKLALDSILYHFPLPNISDTGKVCWGNVSIRSDAPEKTWQSFIESEFNLDYSNNKSKAYPRSVVAQLQAISQSLNTVYPEADLVPTRWTLATLPQIKEYSY